MFFLFLSPQELNHNIPYINKVSLKQRDQKIFFRGKERKEVMGTGKLCDECEADQAASNLLHMKHAKLDEKTSMTLHELQRKTHALLPIQTLNPRDFPPVTSLRGYIAMCSTPYWKKLTQTDMREDQARLIISKRFAEIYLLPLLNKYEDVGKGISVTVYDMNGKIFQMTFKLWTNKVYVLKQGWNNFCLEHELCHDDDFETSVTLWMFRHVQTRKLCFVISPEKSSVIESSKRNRD